MVLQMSWTAGITVVSLIHVDLIVLLLRFRHVPTFGRDSIRKFTSHVSELKKLGARDYENLLQVAESLSRLFSQN